MATVHLLMDMPPENAPDAGKSLQHGKKFFCICHHLLVQPLTTDFHRLMMQAYQGIKTLLVRRSQGVF